MSLLRLPLLAGLALALVSGCSVEDTPSGPDTPGGPAAAASPSRGPEAQDPCTQLALTRLDGQLSGEPSAGPEDTVRANEVVAEFVEAYDKVLVESGVDAARAALADEVAAACQIPPGEGNVVQVPVEQAPAASPTG